MAMHERSPVGPLLMALLLYVAHAALFFSWLIDDAGISYAYARNLANGAGLVSQPGMPPVEGFSNALWTLTVSAVYTVGAFHTFRGRQGARLPAGGGSARAHLARFDESRRVAARGCGPALPHGHVHAVRHLDDLRVENALLAFRIRSCAR